MPTSSTPTKTALLAGARALRTQARALAFDAQLYTAGLRSDQTRRAFAEYERLHRYASQLEAAGRAKA